jgi:hypothetical protein
MKLSFLKKLALPLTLGAIALTTFAGCDASVRYRVGRGYDRTWYGDPYCRNSWDYGCNYGYNDGVRIRFIFGNRHPNYRGGWGRGWGLTADATASRPTSWQEEFNLSSRATKRLKAAFGAALDGNTAPLANLGLGQGDITALQQFRMPSNGSIANAAAHLGVKRADLRDFIEVFTIRMKSGLASND